MAQDIQQVSQRIDALLEQVNAQFAAQFPGLDARKQVKYWPETLGENEQRDTLNYTFAATCPPQEALRMAIRTALAEGAAPDYGLASTHS
ncbi:hypothetical protein GA0116948_108146 [Chitinophaga costaii]|uniref:Uncharacterized protein n=2 Tax=Chitinophaga costaii TaxID=1335309 RepID=A0A1C4EIP0_9BACT|nr:hypothetical protein GA0116948_108146 [Chitinophaga costaii]